MKQLLIALTFLALLSAANQSACQNVKWKMIVPNALVPGRFDPFSPVEFGAIAAKGKIVLAGWKNLILSIDDGATWRNLNAPYASGDFAMEVAIYDDNTFALISYHSGVFISNDQGLSWTLIPTATSGLSIVFDGSPNRLAMVIGGNVVYDIIIGVSGLYHPLLNANYSACIRTAADGTLRVLAGANANTATLMKSYDHDVTWQSTSTINNGDNYTLLADQSDPNRFVAINENWIAHNGNTSNIYLTTDNGNSWNTVFNQPLNSVNALCGNGTTGCHDYFTGTTNAGVLRSNDKGLSWQLIGGPPMTLDSRSLASVDDSLLFAFDTLGNIWATQPASFGPGSYSITGAQFFGQLDLTSCDTSVQTTITFYNSLCQKYDITSAKIIGKDSLEYSLTGNISKPTNYPDSVHIRFTPTKGGKNDAKLLVTYSNGTSTTIDLSVNMPLTSLSISKKILFENDTINLCASDSATLKLTSLCPLDLSSLSVTGTDSASFFLRGKKSAVLPKDSLIKVICIPQRSGLLNATLHIISSDGRTWDVPLSLFVKVAPLAIVAPTATDTISLCSADSIRIVLSAPCSLGITSLSFIGQDSSSFILNGKTSAALPLDSVVVVKLIPKQPGNLSTILHIVTADGRIFDVPLSAFVLPTTVSIQPSALFVNDTINYCTTVTRKLILKAPCPMNFLLALRGLDAASFTLPIPLPNTLPLDSEITVICTPQHSGILDARVEITAGGGVDTIPIHLFVKPAPLSFTPFVKFNVDTITSCESDSAQFVLSTFDLSTQCSLIISSLSITGADASSFVLQGKSTATLPPDSIVKINCIPQHSGKLTAILHIITSDGRSWDVPMTLYVTDPPLEIKPLMLFVGDTVEACIVRSDSVVLNAICPLNISSISIIGKDASSFTLNGKTTAALPADSVIVISCAPITQGDLAATLHLVSSSGTSWDVPLSAFVKAKPMLSLDGATFTDISTDVIGEDISIPVIIHHSGGAYDAEFMIHYDSTSMIYRGVFDLNNADHTFSQFNNFSAQIRFNTGVDTILFARFSFYPLDSVCTHITIDSLKGIGAVTNCLDIPLASDGMNICSTVACGRKILSQYIRYGAAPQLRVIPNPSSGSVTITSSLPLGMVRISATDKLGIERASLNSELSPSEKVKLDLDFLPSGLYFIRVSGISASIPVVIEK